MTPNLYFEVEKMIKDIVNELFVNMNRQFDLITLPDGSVDVIVDNKKVHIKEVHTQDLVLLTCEYELNKQVLDGYGGIIVDTGSISFDFEKLESDVGYVISSSDKLNKCIQQ
jgi:hypothetical protein